MNDLINKLKSELKARGEIYLRIKVRPQASQTEIIEIMVDGTIKLSVAAPPEKGKANLEVIRFFAKEFGIDRADIKLISGAGERLKLIKIKI